MKNKLLCLLFGSLFSISSQAADGLTTIPSDHSVQETANRMVAIIENKGLTLFARINHAENARNVDLSIRPTELIIFGNPKVGTPLMQCAQTVAIDLPQKALIWQDETGQVWFTYNDPMHLKARHGIEDCDEVINKISNVLGKLSQAATTQ